MRIVAIVVFVLSGCATQTGRVISTGPDTLMVTGRNATIGASANQVMLDLYRKANAHCAAQGLVMQEVSSQTHGPGLAAFPEGRLQFRCVKG